MFGQTSSLEKDEFQEIVDRYVEENGLYPSLPFFHLFKQIYPSNVMTALKATKWSIS